MIVKIKSYFLKKDLDASILEKFGFEQFGDNYSRNIDEYGDIRFYGNSRRFSIVDYPWRCSKKNVVKKHIKDLIEANLVEAKSNYEWHTIIGSYRNYPKSKLDKISDKLDKLNKKVGIEW